MMKARIMVFLVGVMLAGLGHALDRNDIQNWVQTIQKIEQWVQDNNITNADMIDDENPYDLEGSMAGAADRHEAIQDIILGYGFSSSNDWANTGARIIDAFGAVLLEESEDQSYDDIQRELDAQLAMLEQDSALDVEQQVMIRDQIESIQAVMARMMSSSEADRDSVRSNRDLLAPVFQ